MDPSQKKHDQWIALGQCKIMKQSRQIQMIHIHIKKIVNKMDLHLA
jgi:hypothetical protein